MPLSIITQIVAIVISSPSRGKPYQGVLRLNFLEFHVLLLPLPPFLLRFLHQVPIVVFDVHFRWAATPTIPSHSGCRSERGGRRQGRSIATIDRGLHRLRTILFPDTCNSSSSSPNSSGGLRSLLLILACYRCCCTNGCLGLLGSCSCGCRGVLLAASKGASAACNHPAPPRRQGNVLHFLLLLLLLLTFLEYRRQNTPSASSIVA